MYLDKDGYYFIEKPEDFDGMVSCTPIKYICTKCSKLYKSQSSYRPHKIDKFKLMLCIDCLKRYTKIERYGDENYNNREKAESTINELYGVNNVMQIKSVKLKGLKTHAEKAGVEYTGETSMFQFKDVQESSKETIQNAYGVDNIMQCDAGKNSYKKSMIEKYNVDHPSKSKELYAKSEQVKLEKYGDPHYNNHKKTVETNLEIYGYETPFHSKEIQESIKDEFMNKYGVMRHIQVDEFQDKIHETMMNRYEGETTYTSPELTAKAKATMQERYGTDNIMSIPYFKEKAKQTSIERYGVPHYTNREQAEQTYLDKFGTTHPTSNPHYYDGIEFDSSWELAYYICQKQNNSEIIREPIKLKFDCEGVERGYIPDFKVNGEYVEIKGGQFIDSDNIPKNPYKDNDPLFDAKLEFIMNNDIELISDKEIKPYIKYVKDNFGSDYLNKYRKSNPNNLCYGYTPFNTDYSKEYQDPIGLGKTPFDIEDIEDL